MMRKPAAAAELIDYINAQIFAGAYLPGQRIPSIRALQKRFGLSYASALSAVDYLCGSGLLVKYPQSGVFVKHIPEATVLKTDKNIGILTAKSPIFPGLVFAVLAAIRRAAERLGYHLVAIPCGRPDHLTTEALKSLIAASPPCSALISIMELDWKVKDLNFDIPIIGVMQENDFEGRQSIVNLDPFSTANLARDYFLERGLDRVRIFTDPRPSYWHRGKIFEYHFLAAGGRVEAFQAMSSDEVDICPELLEHDCAYFFTSDSLTQNICEEYQRQTGGLYQKEFHLLSVDGKNTMMDDFFHFPSIGVDWARIGEIAIEEAVGRMENLHRKPRRIYIPGKPPII